MYKFHKQRKALLEYMEYNKCDCQRVADDIMLHNGLIVTTSETSVRRLRDGKDGISKRMADRIGGFCQLELDINTQAVNTGSATLLFKNWNGPNGRVKPKPIIKSEDSQTPPTISYTTNHEANADDKPVAAYNWADLLCIGTVIAALIMSIIAICITLTK